MTNELRLRLSSYDHRLLDQWVKKLVKALTSDGSSVKGPIPLPVKKQVITICRSPHVDKSSREQFEKRTHRRLIISQLTKKSSENLKNLILPSGIWIKITKK